MSALRKLIAALVLAAVLAAVVLFALYSARVESSAAATPTPARLVTLPAARDLTRTPISVPLPPLLRRDSGTEPPVTGAQLPPAATRSPDAVAGVAIPPGAASGPSAQQWAELRACESGTNYAADTGNGYHGAYQFDLRTWADVGGTGDPASAPPAEQDTRALALFDARGAEPWPTCGRYLR